MASKQALREFQARLTERLQTARATGAAASWLAVEASSVRFLFPLSHSGEIFSWSDVQGVPYVQPWFMGVANLRGGLQAVVDLASFVQGSRSRRRSDSELAQCRLVALNPLLNTNCALLVDRLLGLRTLDSFASSATMQNAPAYFGHVYTDHEGGRWQEINLQTLSLHQAFLSVGV
jgi:twitching motility protein PilI